MARVLTGDEHHVNVDAASSLVLRRMVYFANEPALTTLVTFSSSRFSTCFRILDQAINLLVVLVALLLRQAQHIAVVPKQLYFCQAKWCSHRRSTARVTELKDLMALGPMPNTTRSEATMAAALDARSWGRRVLLRIASRADPANDERRDAVLQTQIEGGLISATSTLP